MSPLLLVSPWTHDFIICEKQLVFACAFDLVEVTPADGAQG